MSIKPILGDYKKSKDRKKEKRKGWGGTWKRSREKRGEWEKERKNLVENMEMQTVRLSVII